MKRVLCLWMALVFVLGGCSASKPRQDGLSVGVWLDHLEENFGDLEGTLRHTWLEGLDVSEDDPLTQEVMSVTLARAMHLEGDPAHFSNAADYPQAEMIQAMLDVGYIALENGQFQGNQLMDEQTALAILEKANDDFSHFTIVDPVYEMEYANEVHELPFSLSTEEGSMPLPGSITEGGLYQDGEQFYWLDIQDGMLYWRKATPEEIIGELELETTFRPDLSEGIQLDPSVVDESPDATTQGFYPGGYMPLKTHYFSFPIKDLKVSGHVSSSSLEVTVKGEMNGLDIEDTFSISDLAITADASLNPFANQNLLLRLDYDLNNVISASKKQATQLSVKEMKPEDLATLRQKIESVTGLKLAVNELDIVTFQFPIPGTLHLMQVGLNLKLYIGLNGEVGLSFSSTQSSGIQVVDGKAIRIQDRSFSIQPYLEGSAELTSGLSVDLRGFGYPIIDFIAETGLGAEARTQAHYVNLKEKVVDVASYEASLEDVEGQLAAYQGGSEAFIDLCADIDIYWLLRFRIGGKGTLAGQFGLSGSWTPLKKSLSLLHIENHRNVGSCTRDYTFVENEELPEGVHLSTQNLSLHPGETSILTLSDASGPIEASWSSSDPNVASVSASGEVKAHASGIAVIKAVGPGGISLSCVVYVPQNLEVVFSPLNATSFHVFGILGI